MLTPATQFQRPTPAPVLPLRLLGRADSRPPLGCGNGEWVARRASAVGVFTVNWQQVCLGVAAAGRPIDA